MHVTPSLFCWAICFECVHLIVVFFPLLGPAKCWNWNSHAATCDSRCTTTTAALKTQSSTRRVTRSRSWTVSISPPLQREETHLALDVSCLLSVVSWKRKSIHPVLQTQKHHRKNKELAKNSWSTKKSLSLRDRLLHSFCEECADFKINHCCTASCSNSLTQIHECWNHVVQRRLLQ